MTGPPFRICTITHDSAQYDAMRASFARAGFDDDVAMFASFRNEPGEPPRYEPYGVIRRVVAEATEPYLVFCHHDVRVDHDGRDALVRRLRELDARDPTWTIAGNAGVDRFGRQVLHLNSPIYSLRVTDLPRRVFCLDENFLVIRRGSAATCSAALSGFHLYGADLCLRATLAGQGCYVIEFLLDHLSIGDATSPDYRAAQVAFMDAWRPHVDLAIVTTTCRPMTFGRARRLVKLARNDAWRRRFVEAGVTLLPARGGPRNAVTLASFVASAAYRHTVGRALRRRGGGDAALRDAPSNTEPFF